MRLVVVALIAVLITACAQTRLIQSDQLPIYGTDPLMNTQYLGSDDQYHYFKLQHGKSGSRVKVRAADARVEPESFLYNSGRFAFVKSVKPGVIRLIVLSSNG